MSGHVLLDLYLAPDATSRGLPRPRRPGRRVAQGDTSLLDLSSRRLQKGPRSGRPARAETSGQAFADLSDQLAQNLAVFPRNGGITVNQYGVFVPASLLGENTQVTHEIKRWSSGAVRVTVSAYPDSQGHTSDPVDCSRELNWLREHKDEYAGQWVALDGDQLIAAGSDARQVYETARLVGVELPLVVQVEPSDELPFAGW